jgi:hypothetical protein
MVVEWRGFPGGRDFRPINSNLREGLNGWVSYFGKALHSATKPLTSFCLYAIINFAGQSILQYRKLYMS